MSEERDWAAFYREHKDDPEIWGEPEEDAPPARKRPLSATITVRFPPEEALEIRELAKNLGISYSDVVRRAVREFVHPHPMLKYKTSSLLLNPRISLTNATTSTGSLDLARG